ncbi:MAG: CBS domain-containing protein [Candidatus Heimdallarchaeota archaeon]|nr:CBS domain-containing protein [Candidatus Heimdallarchaeota archaeon]MCK4972212.1 CBS domain-containing protein [Candidatus Heimdallarchaeota archaeon]
MKSIFDRKKFELAISEIMTTNVISISLETSAEVCAKLMVENNIGSIVVLDQSNKALGIITKENLIKNVIAANADASTVLALDVMTSPVITAPQTMTIIQAMQLMSKQGIRHLVILKKGKVAGMCSDTDIFKVVPQLIMLEQEYLNVLGESQVTEELPDLAGYCDDCKEFREILIFHQGLYICHNCAPVGLLESNE